MAERSSTNPHPAGSPEWQLAENLRGKRQAAASFRADAERYTRKAAELDVEADAYERALLKMTGGLDD